MSAYRAAKFSEDMARTAHESGFDALFMGHHYLLGPDHQMFQPLVMLPYVLGLCPGMYIGTSIYIVPLRDPITLAEEVASLDVLSGGRFLFGVGRGYRDDEFQAIGLERTTRSRRLREAINAMRILWTTENASFTGDFYSFYDVTLSVRPDSPGGPPVLVGADTLTTVAAVPEIGDSWVISPRHSRAFLREAMPVYRAALESNGKGFAGLTIARDLFVGETEHEANELVSQAFEEMRKSYRAWGITGADEFGDDFSESARDRAIVGTPAMVSEQILEYEREFGIDWMWFRLYWPGMDMDRALDLIRLVGSEVLPMVRRDGSNRGPQSQPS